MRAIIAAYFLLASADFASAQNCVVTGSTVYGSVEQHCIINARGKFDLYQNGEKVGKISAVRPGPNLNQITFGVAELYPNGEADFSKSLELQDAIVNCNFNMRINPGQSGGSITVMGPGKTCDIVGTRNSQ